MNGTNNRRKPPYRALPYIAGLGAASLPAASLAQYLNTEYPRYQNVLQNTPLTIGKNENDFHDFMGKLKPGDIMAQLADPTADPLGTRGAGTPTGAPFSHSAIVADVIKNKGATGNNLKVPILEGGWAHPPIPAAYEELPPTAYSPYKFDQLMPAVEELPGTISDAAEFKPGMSLPRKMLEVAKHGKKVSNALGDLWRYHTVVEPAQAQYFRSSMPTPSLDELKNKVLTDATNASEDSVLFMRPNAAVEKDPQAMALLNEQIKSSTGKPYSDYAAIKASLKHVFLPATGPHKSDATYVPTSTSTDYCATPAGSFLNGLGVPCRGDISTVMPADPVANPALSGLGIYAPKNSDIGSAADPRKAVMHWLDEARKYRIRAGAFAIGAAGLGGYGIAKVIQHLKQRSLDNKAKQALQQKQHVNNLVQKSLENNINKSAEVNAFYTGFIREAQKLK